MKNIFILILCLVVCSCTEGNKFQTLVETNPSIKVTIPESQIPCWNLKKQSYNASTDFFDYQIDSIRLVPLQNRDDIVIGAVSHIEIIEDKLVVVDMNKAQQIFVFDKQGNFLNTIGNKGEGPGEYTSINQFVVSPDGICVLDWMKWKYLCYDLDGNLCYEHQFKKGVPEMILRWDKHQYVGSHASYNPKEPYHLTWRNDKDSLLNTGLPIMNVHSAPAGKLQYAQDGSVLFYHLLCDTVYQITDKAIIPKWRLGLYESNEVSSFLDKTKNIPPQKYMQQLYDFKSGEIVNHFELCEGDNHWIVEYQYGPHVYISVVDKENGHVNCYLKTDINKRECYVPFVFSGTYNDWICTSLDQAFYTEIDNSMQEQFLRHIKSEEQREMIRNYDIENNNPIICLFHLK